MPAGSDGVSGLTKDGVVRQLKNLKSSVVPFHVLFIDFIVEHYSMGCLIFT
jgi:hypothetical protein